MVDYVASTTMADFHLDTTNDVRALMGPIGSGKSVACCAEMLIKSFAQTPHYEHGYDADGNPIGRGVRSSRWVIVRNTYRELMDTTIKTFFDWYPESQGLFKKMDLTFITEQRLPDGTTAHIEFLFRALDKPQDVKKLLSLEVTGGWINEAREVPKTIMEMLLGRTGRYPKTGTTWAGIIMDTNPPDSDHWWYKLFDVTKPEGYALFKQPSGMSEEAENLENLLQPPMEIRSKMTLQERREHGRRYYTRMIPGKDKEWVNVYVHGQYGFVQDGKPVYPEYKDDVHYSSEAVIIPDGATIFVGIDFGLTPAAVFGFKTAAGRWIVFDEVVTEDMGAKNFGRLLNQHINRWYPNFTLEIYGDPAGDQRAQTDETTPFQILLSEGINAWPTHTNDVVIRREAVAAPMQRMDFAGNPGLLIGPKCIMYRKALAGGYKYKRMAVSGAEKFMDKPDKGRYSHVADAGQYLMVGAGEGTALIQNDSWAKPIDYSEQDAAIL